MLQPSQLGSQRLIGLHQLRKLPGHAADLPIPRRELLGLLGELPGLACHHDEQFVARHLLRPGHRKIEPQSFRSTRQRHASNILHSSISTGPIDAPRAATSSRRLNVYGRTSSARLWSSPCRRPLASYADGLARAKPIEAFRGSPTEIEEATLTSWGDATSNVKLDVRETKPEGTLGALEIYSPPVKER